VTLGDEEARRRGTQKTVLERKAPPTFDVLVEQEDRHRVAIHHDVAGDVDGLLRGDAPEREIRERQPDGTLRSWVEHAPRQARADGVGIFARELPVTREERPAQAPARGRRGWGASPLVGTPLRPPWWERSRAGGRAESGTSGYRSANGDDASGWLDPELALSAALRDDEEEDSWARGGRTGARAGGNGVDASTPRPRRIYAMGVNRNHLEQAIRELGVPAVIVRDDREADAVLVLKNVYRKQTDQVDAYQSAGLPVHILRSSSVDWIREALIDLFHVDARTDATPPGAPEP
jgi:hypothetical protein